MNELNAVVIIIWVLPLALLLGFIIRGLEELFNRFRKPPLERLLKKSRETEIPFQFIPKELNPKTGKKKQKHRDRRDYKKST